MDFVLRRAIDDTGGKELGLLLRKREGNSHALRGQQLIGQTLFLQTTLP